MRQDVAAAIMILAAGLVRADGAPGPAIEGVIGAQIEAFKADDFTRAFGFASPGIRAIFVTPESFGEMVRGGYPMVWHPKSVKFLDLREEAGALWQRVLVSDGAGVYYTLDYKMVQVDGGWRIDGVTVERMLGVGA